MAQPTLLNGIYGVILDEDANKMLLVRKTAGPYKGLLDLPGGQPELNESFEETLAREIKKATGMKLAGSQLLTCLLDRQQFEGVPLRHTGIVYVCNPEGKPQKPVSAIDSDEFVWLDIDEAETSKQCAPFAKEAATALIQLFVEEADRLGLFEEEEEEED